jgi:hypothetical protein
MAELNLNNLMLDDNAFELLPDGDYHFVVESHEIGYSQSEKLPPNTQQIIVHLEIPVMGEDGYRTVSVRHSFNVWKKSLFALRQFAECIALMGEKGRAAFDVDKIDGLTGICNIGSYENAKGNTYNSVQLWYAPSKAPVVTANDDAWAKRGSLSFVEVDAGELPF